MNVQIKNVKMSNAQCEKCGQNANELMEIVCMPNCTWTNAKVCRKCISSYTKLCNGCDTDTCLAHLYGNICTLCSFV